MTSVNSTGQCWREVDFSSSGSSEGFFYSPRAADTLPPVETGLTRGVTRELPPMSPATLAILDKYADTPSTQKARTCLMQMLTCKEGKLGLEAGVLA